MVNRNEASEVTDDQAGTDPHQSVANAPDAGPSKSEPDEH
jgi:hypothetical protein